MRKRSRQQEEVETGRGAKVAAAIGRHPREFVGIIMATGATAMIFVNALFLQKGPHPAPIFATRPVVAVPAPPPRVQIAPAPAPVAPPVDNGASRTQLISDIQRELNRRGYYDGTVDGVWGARTDAAARDFAQATGLKINVEASDALLRAILSAGAKRTAAEQPARTNDPIAQLIAPSKRVLAVQRALADFGYGQLKPTGLYDPDTRAAIEKFERDRRLPVTGQISDRVVRELAAMTGRPLE